jgi:hypothetical protein
MTITNKYIIYELMKDIVLTVNVSLRSVQPPYVFISDLEI